jgi:hypothetical protein
LNAFTASQEILNTTFATTGSNTFKGANTFELNVAAQNGFTTIGQTTFGDGQILNTRLQLGSEKWLLASLRKDRLTDSLFMNFLGRTPTMRERRATNTLLSEKPDGSEIQDLVWALTLLPEFQLIY